MGVCAGGAVGLTTPQTSIAERLAMWTPVVVLGIVITRRDRRRRKAVKEHGEASNGDDREGRES
jgi:membrane protein implicated in regulation of membrane protease activity